MKNFLTKVGNVMRSRSTQIAVGSAAVAGAIVAGSGLAGATAYDPTSALTTLASNATSVAAPIVVAVAGGC